MASASDLIFNNNTIEIKLDDSVKSINIPGVTAEGQPGPWDNGKTITGVSGSALQVELCLHHGEMAPLDLIEAPQGGFPEGWQLSATGKSIRSLGPMGETVCTKKWHLYRSFWA